MILGVVGLALIGALASLTGLMPSWIVPDVFTSGTWTAFEFLASVNDVVPVWTFGIVFGLGLALNAGLAVWDFGVWVYHQVWGSS